MSNHREMSLQDVYNMLSVIKQGLQDVRNGSKYALFLVIVLLYEYCLCYAFFQVHPEDERTYKPLNHKDLKGFINPSKNTTINYSVNEFFNIRNKIAHCDNLVFYTNEILYLLKNKYFESILRKCAVPDDIIMAVSMYYDIYPVNNPKELVYRLNKAPIPDNEIALCVTYEDCVALANRYKQFEL